MTRKILEMSLNKSSRNKRLLPKLLQRGKLRYPQLSYNQYTLNISYYIWVSKSILFF